MSSSSIRRCMGIKCFEPQCQTCERLPRDKHPEDEDAKFWMTPNLDFSPCKDYRPGDTMHYREDEARAILDEVEARR